MICMSQILIFAEDSEVFDFSNLLLINDILESPEKVEYICPSCQSFAELPPYTDKLEGIEECYWCPTCDVRLMQTERGCL